MLQNKTTVLHFKCYLNEQTLEMKPVTRGYMDLFKGGMHKKDSISISSCKTMQHKTKHKYPFVKTKECYDLFTKYTFAFSDQMICNVFLSHHDLKVGFERKKRNSTQLGRQKIRPSHNDHHT